MVDVAADVELDLVEAREPDSEDAAGAAESEVRDLLVYSAYFARSASATTTGLSSWQHDDRRLGLTKHLSGVLCVYIEERLP